eukprot:2757337-Amphidinium_carterae.1
MSCVCVCARVTFSCCSQEGGELYDVADVGLTGAPSYRLEQEPGLRNAKPVSIPEHAGSPPSQSIGSNSKV